jgi:LPS export ABC transporter protein LptC
MKHLRLLTCLAFTLALAACQREEGPVAAGFEPLPVDVVLAGVTHYITVDGVRNAKLLSDSVYQHQDSAQVQLFGVDLTLYDGQGGPSATVTSRTGALNERTNAMVARGNVVLLRQNGAERIETEELHYDPQAQRIWSDVATTRTLNGAVQRGDGFNADLTPEGQFRNLQIRNARGTGAGIRF